MIVLLDKDTNVQEQVKGRCILTVYNLHILYPVLQTSWRVPGVVLTTVRGRDEDLVDGRVPYRDRLRESNFYSSLRVVLVRYLIHSEPKRSEYINDRLQLSRGLNEDFMIFS